MYTLSVTINHMYHTKGIIIIPQYNNNNNNLLMARNILGFSLKNMKCLKVPVLFNKLLVHNRIVPKTDKV